MSENLDDLIEHSRAGLGARKVDKPRVEVAPSPIVGDPERPDTAAVNAKVEMSYADALAAKQAGTLRRQVLTERGWVTP